jgi:hypothetical protein
LDADWGQCVAPIRNLLGGEDDPVGDLTALREQMVRALAQLDATLEELKKRQAR